MGEAKRRKTLGLPPRKKNLAQENNYKTSKLNQILNKFPFLPYIFGISLLLFLVFDLISFYK